MKQSVVTFLGPRLLQPRTQVPEILGTSVRTRSSTHHLNTKFLTIRLVKFHVASHMMNWLQSRDLKSPTHMQL